MNVLPSPSLLSAQIRPWWAVTMPRQIARPSPVPPCSRRSGASTCSNGLKMCSSLSAGMPRPVSATVNRASSPSGATSTVITPPLAENLIALAISCESACTIRSGSASTVTGAPATTMRSPAVSASGRIRSTARSTRSGPEHGSRRPWSPDPIWSRDSMSLTSRVSRSVLALVMASIRRVSGPAPASRSSARISSDAPIEVSGVRSSWLTIEMMSVFSRSSASRSFSARARSAEERSAAAWAVRTRPSARDSSSPTMTQTGIATTEERAISPWTAGAVRNGSR